MLLVCLLLVFTALLCSNDVILLYSQPSISTQLLPHEQKTPPIFFPNHLHCINRSYVKGSLLKMKRSVATDQLLHTQFKYESNRRVYIIVLSADNPRTSLRIKSTRFTDSYQELNHNNILYMCFILSITQF